MNSSAGVTRRDFLEASVAGGGLAAAAPILAAETSARPDAKPDAGPDAKPPVKKPQIAAYTGAMSCHPGQLLAFHVSADVPRYTATITRIGAEPKVVWKSDAIAGAKHPTPKDASMHGCHWPEA